MNTKLIGVLLAFALWGSGSSYWYLCKIKQKCCDTETTTSTVMAAVSEPTPVAPENVDNTTPPTETVEELANKTVLYFPFKSIQFDEDAATNAYLTKLAKELSKENSTHITIIGHTDDIGNDDRNMTLSLARANKVKAFLKTLGAQPSKIKVEGKGENEPLVQDTSLEARNKNRRVEIIFNN